MTTLKKERSVNVILINWTVYNNFNWLINFINLHFINL